MTIKPSAQYQCSENTPAKQAHLQSILNQMMWLIAGVRTKNDWAREFSPVYFDLFAGPGVDPNGEPGSPVIFAEIARKQSFPWEAYFFEYELATMMKLADCLVNIYPQAVICNTSNENVSDKLHGQRPWQFGIAYADPSNADLLAVIKPLNLIADVYPRVDVLLNFAAASWKRQHELERYQCLADILKRVPKQYWLITEPRDRFQWVMLLGTNYPKELKAKGWYDVRIPPGNDYLMRVIYTHDELESMHYRPGQIPLLGDDE